MIPFGIRMPPLKPLPLQYDEEYDYYDYSDYYGDSAGTSEEPPSQDKESGESYTYRKPTTPSGGGGGYSSAYGEGR